MEFRSWGKTPRLFRDIVITEKIDGTNSAVIIEERADTSDKEGVITWVSKGDKLYAVGAQSKNRIITPGKATDNYNFAQWVQENAQLLVEKLGVGYHFGEWWGKGIQRRYGDLSYRTFSLFNTAKHKGTRFRTDELNGTPVNVESVPVLFEGQFSERVIHEVAREMLRGGSVAAPFAPNPEGICVYHTQSKQVYKFTFDQNDKGKWEYESVSTQD